MADTLFPTASLPYAVHLKYPVSRTTTMKTAIQQFEGDQEVRWVDQLPVSKFTLTYNNIPLSAVIILREFFESQTGASTSVFDLTLDMPDGTTPTWNNLLFDTDTFTATNNSANLWNVVLPLRQTRVS